jgi:hypothetical protein
MQRGSGQVRFTGYASFDKEPSMRGMKNCRKRKRQAIRNEIKRKMAEKKKEAEMKKIEIENFQDYSSISDEYN